MSELRHENDLLFPELPSFLQLGPVDCPENPFIVRDYIENENISFEIKFTSNQD